MKNNLIIFVPYCKEVTDNKNLGESKKGSI